MRWRISSTAPVGNDLRFQILGENDNQPIDFSQSLFPGGASPCADAAGGTCFQYVVPGQYSVASFPHPVIGIHATYGTLPGALATARTEDQTLAVAPFFQLTNDQVHAGLTDTVAFEPPYVFARPYDRTMWSTLGLCIADSVPTSVSFSPLDPQSYTFPADQPLSDAGFYCVGIRPTPSGGGASALDSNGCTSSHYCPSVAQGRLATLPQVVEMHQTFTPPVEQSPIIYQIVFDLEVSVPERCDSALMKIENLVDEYMKMPLATNPSLQVHKLETLNIAKKPDATTSAPNCTQLGQGPEALPDPTGMAADVLQLVSGSPEIYKQFHLFYFNNQNIMLPPSMTDSLEVLFNGLGAPPAPYNLRIYSWLFNPGLATATGPGWWMSTPWQSADDPNLEITLASYFPQNLPYTSQIFDPNVPVPLLSAADAATYDGGSFKICDASPQVQPVYLTSGQRLYGQSWAIKASDPPGYFVSLLPNIEKPGPSFTPESASIDFEICTAYCTHPYVSTAGTGVTSWATSPLCAETK